MKKPSWLLIEKPQFNRAPKVKLSVSRYCYLFPTGCGHSKSVADHRFESGYGPDVYKCQFQWITFHYTWFFLWFRLDISMWQSTEGMGASMMQNFRPTDKSKTTIEDILK